MIQYKSYRAEHKNILMVEPHSFSQYYITKQLEYITKGHIEKITQSHLSTAQASSYFKHLNTRMPTLYHTELYN